MSERMKPIGSVLAPLFADLQRRSQAVVNLTARVREALPGPEKDHVLSASYREGTLCVEADSAAWSVHIRYAQEVLLERLNASGETQFTKVRVRVGKRKAVGG